MPIPTPKSGEKQDDFISRCMSNKTMLSDFPDQEQRSAVCFDAWRESKKNEAGKKQNKLLTFAAHAEGELKEEDFNGKPHLVVPIVALIEGVVQGELSVGPELVTAKELAKHTISWNGRPVTLGHPEQNGIDFPATTPEILETFQIGTIFDAELKEDKLLMNAWLDLEKIEALGEEALSTLERIRNMENVEVSTGYFARSIPIEGKFDGDNFQAIQEEIIPDHLAIQIETIESLGTKEGVDMFAVRDRRDRGLGAGLVHTRARQSLSHHRAPDEAAIISIQSEHLELIHIGRLLGAESSASSAPPPASSTSSPGLVRFRSGNLWSGFSLFRFDLSIGLYCGQDIHAITVNDRRSVSAARNLGLPADVLGRTPLDGRLCIRGIPGSIGASPLRPVRSL